MNNQLEIYELKKELRAEKQTTAQLLEHVLAWQAGTSAQALPFILPLAYLKFYESIQNEVEKKWFWNQHSETLKTAVQARQWEVVKNQEGQIRAAGKPRPGSFSAQYEAMRDPVGKRVFFEKYEAEIKQEAEERNHEVRLAVAAANGKSPETLAAQPDQTL